MTEGRYSRTGRRRLPGTWLLGGLAGGAASLVLLLTMGCTHGLQALQHPPVEDAVTTGGIWSSMIYLTRTDSGVVAVDLGWVGSRNAMRAALARLGAKPEDVRAVLITHSHRDHIAEWRGVRHATFYMSAPESALFVGAAQHRGGMTRFVESLKRTPLPEPGEVRVQTFSGDTTLIFGRDTVRAFSIPGHTAGSAAYLVRTRLFMGDALNMLPVVGFRKARKMYSDDVDRSTASVAALWQRLPLDTTRTVCTAHAKCTNDSEALRRAALH